MTAIIVDLDGTIYDSAHREHLAREKNWEAFHEAAKDDKPRRDVHRILDFLCDSFTIIGCTGRNERYRAATNDWLLRHQIHLDHLLMRPDNNFTPDNELKPTLLFDHFGGKDEALAEVLLILEDRDKMVEAWRNLGFNCWQVRAGGY